MYGFLKPRSLITSSLTTSVAVAVKAVIIGLTLKLFINSAIKL